MTGKQYDGWSPIAKIYDPLQAGSIDGTDEHPHDMGIVRALNAKYKPSKRIEGDPSCTVFVSRLNPETIEETLQDAFSRYGDVVSVKLIRDIVTGFSKCYCFIEFESESRAINAARNANKLYVDGNEIFVDMECERTLKGWIPRRLGGGFGGKRESGQLRFGGKDRPYRKPILVEQSNEEKSSTRDEDRNSKETSDKSRRESRDHRHSSRYRSRSRSRERHRYRSRTPDRRHAKRRDRSRSKSSTRRSRYDDSSRKKGR